MSESQSTSSESYSESESQLCGLMGFQSLSWQDGIFSTLLGFVDLGKVICGAVWITRTFLWSVTYCLAMNFVGCEDRGWRIFCTVTSCWSAAVTIYISRTVCLSCAATGVTVSPGLGLTGSTLAVTGLLALNCDCLSLASDSWRLCPDSNFLAVCIS